MTTAPPRVFRKWQAGREVTDVASQRPGSRQNISRLERWGSIAAGSGLILVGLIRRRWTGLAMAISGAALLQRGMTGHCHAYQAMGLNTAEGYQESSADAGKKGGLEKVEQRVTIQRDPSELYRFWRELQNLPRVMYDLQEVRPIDEKRSRWVAYGALGRTVEWDAEISEERENEFLAWRSLPNSEVETNGFIRFTRLPHNRGTLVTVSMEHRPPLGKLGATVASILGHGLDNKLEESLRRFKSLMEAGEIPSVAGQPAGAGRQE